MVGEIIAVGLAVVLAGDVTISTGSDVVVVATSVDVVEEICGGDAVAQRSCCLFRSAE